MFGDIFSNLERSRNFSTLQQALPIIKQLKSRDTRSRLCSKPNKRQLVYKRELLYMLGLVLLNIMSGMNNSVISEENIHRQQSGFLMRSVGKTGSAMKRKRENLLGFGDPRCR